MKKGLTEISFILDRSTSMGHLTGKTIEGFNSFVSEQRKNEGSANLSLTLFDTKTEQKITSLKLNQIPLLTEEDYITGGCTALHDAIGTTIVMLGKRLNEMDESEKPEKVLVIIFTDGEENSSSLYKASDIKEMIKHQTDVYNWEFVFMGCNQDAALSSSELGIHNYANVGFSPQGMTGMYDELSRGVSSYRSNVGSLGQMPENISGE